MFLATWETPWRGDEFFVFDLECVAPHGTDALTHPEQCRIYDLSFRHLRTGAHYTTMVDPEWPSYPPVPPHSGLPQITQSFLRAHGARPFRDIIHGLMAFVARVVRDRTAPVVFVAHGCFVLDKALLEAEFARLSRTMPNEWRFYDTLPLFRQRFRHQPSYALGALYLSLIHI